VRDAAEFADLSTRVACYLGDTGMPLYLDGSRFPLDPDVVSFFDPALVRDPGWVADRPTGRGAVVVHRLTPATVKQILTRRETATIVDGRLHSSSEREYFHLRSAATWPTYKPVEVALEMLRTIPNPGRRAFVLATGPSALTVDLAVAAQADIRIICNSAVRNVAFLEQFRPNIIACTDPVFHMGPSRYAAEFRRDLIRAVELTDAIVLTGSNAAGPLPSLAPVLRERLAAIPYARGGAWRWPTPRDPTVRPSTSVMTGLMLPVALMLSDEVAVAGADGRQPTENYFWTHSPQLQYSDAMMQTVFDAHPAFFRDRDYEDSYDDYCHELESLCGLAEAAGKIVRGAAPSWIPALRSRGAPAPLPSGRGQ
jgi:hypothetical protein